MHKIIAMLLAVTLHVAPAYAAGSGAAQLGEYRFDYTLAGDGDAIPLQVFSDGKRTFVQLKGAVTSASFEDADTRNLFEAVREGNLFVLPSSVRRLRIQTAGGSATAIQTGVKGSPAGAGSASTAMAAVSPPRTGSELPTPAKSGVPPIVEPARVDSATILVPAPADSGGRPAAPVQAVASVNALPLKVDAAPAAGAPEPMPALVSAPPLRMDSETEVFEFEGLRGRRLSALLRANARAQKWVDILWDLPYDLVLDSDFKFVARSYPDLLLKVLQPFGLSADLHNPNRLITVYETRGLSK